MKTYIAAALTALGLATFALPAAADTLSVQFPTLTFADEMPPAPACDPATAPATSPCTATGH